MAAPGDYILVNFVDTQAIGLQFERKRLSWPLHITLMPWFCLQQKTDEPQLDQVLQGMSQENLPFSLKAGGVEYFGAKADVPVHVIENQAPVQIFHKTLKARLDDIGVIYRSELYVDDNFVAHVTQHGDQKLHIGDLLNVVDFCLVKLQPENICRVVKRYSLGYNT